MLKQFIEKKEEEFEEQFLNVLNCYKCGESMKSDLLPIKSFHSQSLSELSLLLRERIEGKKGLGEIGTDGKPIEWNVGYNQALSDILALLDNQTKR